MIITFYLDNAQHRLGHNTKRETNAIADGNTRRIRRARYSNDRKQYLIVGPDLIESACRRSPATVNVFVENITNS